ncbi:MAG: hypothetical protein LBJ96_02670, partial [Holosporaceae bacterium]|jgi:hypothetical protein|nr:hypothetical protein [Holosporaceae bacterium]
MAGFTVPVNHALYQYELQTYPNNEPHVAAAAVAIVTADACTKLAAAVADAEEDTKVYVIKYGTTDDALDSCADDPDNIYTVDSEAELNEALHEIAADIKSFAGYSAPQMAEI